MNNKYVERLKKEQEAEVLVIANNSTIKAKVDEISKKPSTSSSIGSSMDASSNSLSNYDVTLLLDSQENILDGYHVQATVFEEEKELKIPKEAIIEENGETFVYKVEDGALKKQNVEYEDSENDDAKILSGLEEGEEVVTNPTEDTKEGMKYE